MKFSGNIIKSLMLSALSTALLLTAPGCIREDIPADCPEPKDVVLQISVNANGGVQTKATVDATPIESVINTLRIYAFIGDEMVGHFAYSEPDDDVISNSDGSKNFYMHVEAHSTALQVVDFYVIANEKAMKSSATTGMGFSVNTTRKQLDDAKFTQIDGLASLGLTWNDAANDYEQTGKLPYGMPNIAKATYTLNMSEETSEFITEGVHKDHMKVTAIYPGAHTTIPEGVEAEKKLSFSLERPTGKLRLYAAAAAGTGEESPLQILNARLLPAGARIDNYVMPKTAEDLKKTHNTVQSGIPMLTNAKVQCTVFPLAKTDANEDEFNAARQVESNYTMVLPRDFYPYENPFGSDDWNVADSDGKGHVIEIEYRFGDAGEVKKGIVNMQPVKRNHFYKVYCLMSNTGIVSITYSVEDWETVQWGMGDDKIKFEYPTYKVLRPYGSNIDIPEGKVFEQLPLFWNSSDGSGDFLAEFEITNPVGQLFRPTINGPINADQFGIQVWRKDKWEARKNAEDKDAYDAEYALKDISGQNDQTGYEIVNDATYISGNPYVIRIYPKNTPGVVMPEEAITMTLIINFKPAWDATDVLRLFVNGYKEHVPYWNQNGAPISSDTGTKTNDNPEVLAIRYYPNEAMKKAAVETDGEWEQKSTAS